MKLLIRWGKFSLVGAIGTCVQIAALWVLNRWLGHHYLWASAIALELTLLHNFAGHVLFTWRDRRDRGSLLRQMVRFHLANGVVSMAGSLALLPLLVERAKLPVIAANLVVIACCGVANFTLGHRWAFALPELPPKANAPRSLGASA